MLLLFFNTTKYADYIVDSYSHMILEFKEKIIGLKCLYFKIVYLYYFLEIEFFWIVALDSIITYNIRCE